MVNIIKAVSIPLAMIIVGLLTYAAMSNGIDGAVFMMGVGIVGGLGGFEARFVYNYFKTSR
jgi:hypothetical protein